MALKLKVQIDGDAIVSKNELFAKLSGTVEAETYVKIDRLDCDKENATIYVSFSSESISGQKIYAMPVLLDGPNFFQQGYEFLKGLAEFSGATDC